MPFGAGASTNTHLLQPPAPLPLPAFPTKAEHPPPPRQPALPKGERAGSWHNRFDSRDGWKRCVGAEMLPTLLPHFLVGGASGTARGCGQRQTKHCMVKRGVSLSITINSPSKKIRKKLCLSETVFPQWDSSSSVSPVGLSRLLSSQAQEPRLGSKTSC